MESVSVRRDGQPDLAAVCNDDDPHHVAGDAAKGVQGFADDKALTSRPNITAGKGGAGAASSHLDLGLVKVLPLVLQPSQQFVALLCGGNLEEDAREQRCRDRCLASCGRNTFLRGAWFCDGCQTRRADRPTHKLHIAAITVYWPSSVVKNGAIAAAFATE